MLVRFVDRVLPGGDTLAALFTNFVLGAAAIFLLGVLARRLYGQQVAAKAMVLGAMFPGSFVLSFAYTEALLLVLAMGCLWCLMSKRWVAAGLLAALGTATRPNGLALVLACAVALVPGDSRRAGLEVARRADPRAGRLHRVPAVARPPHG